MASPSILIVDDHPIFSDGALQVLKSLFPEASCRTVTNGRQALELLDRGIRFNVILTDLKMPGISGPQLITALKERCKSAKIVVFSGTQDIKTLSLAEQNGAVAFLSKDQGTEEIGEVLMAVMDGVTFDASTFQTKLPTGPAPFEIQFTDSEESRFQLAKEIGLSERNLEVLNAVAEGLTNKDIALSLRISEATVKTHLSHIFRCLNVNSRTQSVSQARNIGLLI